MHRFIGLTVAIAILVPLCSPLSTAGDNVLKPFSTDGCSLWISGPPSSPNLWRHCCVAHDKAYWVGGTEADRAKADENLQQCVARVAGDGMADYMYVNVRWGGAPFWLTSYRWGYGWPYWDNGKQRGYRPLTQEELEQVKQLESRADQLIAADAINYPVHNVQPHKP